MIECKHCNKLVEKLTPRSTRCRECKNEYMREWKKNNPDKVKANTKRAYEVNKEKRLKEGKEWREKNKEYLKEYHKNYFQENKKEIYQYWKHRRDTDIEHRISKTIRTRIWNAIQDFNLTKKDKTLEILGCSIKDYLLHLEQQFDKGMNWDNYGIYWEIDHIIPVSKGGSFHYTNTQPLTISENRTKKDNL